MPSRKRLIIGLGNPGAEYEGTRHNIGFMVVDALAAKAGASFSHEKEAFVAWAQHRGHPYGLAKPLTYVNRSGQAAQKLARAYGLEPREMLVLVDDINLDPGTIRLRTGGSAGGHNGMQDIIDRLATREIPRLRLGVGSDFPRGRMADYVLSPFSRDEQPLIDEALVRAQKAALCFVTDGIQTAMNRYN